MNVHQYMNGLKRCGVCVYIYIYRETMEYYSAIKRNKVGSFVEMWMVLETVIQSEINQKEKNKYCVLMHMWNLGKCQLNLYLQDRNRCANTENIFIDTGKGEGRWNKLGN